MSERQGRQLGIKVKAEAEAETVAVHAAAHAAATAQAITDIRHADGTQDYK